MLDNLADEEWIYWCIDRNYPIILHLHRVETLVTWVWGIEDDRSAGSCSAVVAGWWDAEHLTGETTVDDVGDQYPKRKGYEQTWT